MGETRYSKGAATGDAFKPALYFNRRFGGVEFGVVNTGEAAGLSYKIEGAAGPADTSEVGDWTVVDEVYASANVAGDVAAIRDIAPGSATHKHYRISVKSQAPATPTSYLVWAEDEKA